MPVPSQLVDAHSSVQQNFDDLSQFLKSLFGGREPRIRWGSVGVTWPGATKYAAATVNHGLGRAPVSVIATSDGSNADSFVDVQNLTATQFTVVVVAAFVNPAAATADTVRWLAIG